MMKAAPFPLMLLALLSLAGNLWLAGAPQWSWIPAALAAWYLADLVSGLTHMVMDYKPCRPGIGLAEAGRGGVADRSQAQVARRTWLRVLGQQVQRQAERGRGGAQRIRVGERQQPAIAARLLDEADAEFRANPGRLARDQSELGNHGIRAWRARPPARPCPRRGPRCGS